MANKERCFKCGAHLLESTPHDLCPKCLMKVGFEEDADATLDTRVCVICRTADEIRQFRGNNLRLNFPYLEIQDELTILPNAHPNCRCVLKRIIGGTGKV